MKHPTFLQGIVIALGFALSGAAIFSTLTLVYASSFILKALITGFAGLYVIYLLARSEERTGRVTVPVLWLAGAMLTWLLSPGLMAFLIAHVAAVWLIRSLYYHSSVLPALLDLALCALSVVAARRRGPPYAQRAAQHLDPIPVAGFVRPHTRGRSIKPSRAGRIFRRGL